MLFVIRFGELTLKSRRVRNRFLAALERNLRASLSGRGVFFDLKVEWSRAYLQTQDKRAESVLQRCFGVHSYSRAEAVEFQGLDQLIRAGADFFRDAVQGKRFAVRCKRSGRHGFSSLDVEKQLGAALFDLSGGVDLENPDITCFVEVRGTKAWFFSEKRPGPGGLPVGTGPKLLAMLSGGCDSGLAAWMAMKRGSPVDYLFFNLGGPEHRQRALASANFLAENWAGAWPGVLTEMDFGPVVSMIRRRVKQQYWNMALKWAFYTAGKKLAEHGSYKAVITGEAAAQVSTQTLPNLQTLSQATGLYPLRPLIFWDKQDITQEALRVGLAPGCQRSREFCDLAGARPVVASRPGRLMNALREFDASLIQTAFENRSVHQLPARHTDELGLVRVPEGAVLLDLREPAAFQAWHPEGAILMSLDQVEFSWNMPVDRVYLFYCGNDLKSARAAELLTRRGYKAFYLKGGVKTLMKDARK